MDIQVKITKDILKRTAHCGEDLCEVRRHCGIAEAVRELLPTAIVFGFAMVFSAEDERRRDGMRLCEGPVVYLPPVARRFVNDFDRATPEQRMAMPEISFWISVPDQLIESIGIEEVTRIVSESKTMSLV